MDNNVKSQTALLSSKVRKYGLWLIIAIVLFTIVGFLVLPPVAKHVLVGQLSDALHRPVSIEKVSINPYELSAVVDGLEIKEKEGDQTFVGFDSLQVNLQSSSLFRWGAIVQEIKLLNPKFHVVRTAENRYNFSDIIDEFAAKPKSDGPTPAFSLNNIQISGGTVEFDDQLVKEKHVISDIGLTMPFISNMGVAVETFVEPHFSANINGAPLDIQGKTKPFSESRESEFLLALNSVKIATYFDYSPVKLPLKIESGTLDTDLSVIFREEQGTVPKLLLSGKAEIKGLKVNESSGQPLLSLKQLAVAIDQSDLLDGKFAIKQVSVDSPEITTHVSHDGQLNWLELMPKETAQNKGKPAEPTSAAKKEVEWSLGEIKVNGGALHWLDESNAKPLTASVEAIDIGLKGLDSKNMAADFNAAWKINGDPWLKVDSVALKEGKLDLKAHKVQIGDAWAKGVQGLIKRSADGKIEWIEPPALRLAGATQDDTSAPWVVVFDKYVGENIGMRFEDSAVSPKTTQTLEGLSFEVTNLTTEPGHPAKLKTSFKLNRKGEVAVDGELTPMPLKADLNLDVKTIELLPLQPYFADKLNVNISRGHVTLKGNAKLQQAAAGSKDALAGFSGDFAGQLTVGDFNAVDKQNSADFLRWKSFYVGKADVKFGPESVSIGEVALSDFFARVIVSPEGKLNLMQIVRNEKEGPKPVTETPAPETVESAEGKATAPVTVSDKPVMPVKIGKITLQGGNVRFSDNFIKPNYTANLKEIGGSVTNLSSDAGSQASLELRGNYDNVAPLNIAAKINPLSAKPSLDLQAEIKGIELTSLSAYSGKYAGYEIDKGKLSVSVKYKIEDDQLEAENRIFLDQLTFGNAVESPDAVKLPVRLAVSLLKNSRGEIDVNLPISGSLNDPQFSVGGLVMKVIINLLTKAITSPFALIGSMFGGGEELSNVEFDYGRSALTQESVKRLESLSKALIDKPDLKIEIEGKVDAEQDPEGLKHARIDRKVRALKRADRNEKGAESEATGRVEVTPEEYPELLERVYREEKFPKPRNMIGMVKSLPVEEMEKLMLANSTVDDDDLRDLGDRRAKAVRDWLVQHEVPADRVFLLPSKIVGANGSSSDGETKAKNSRADFSLKM